MSYELGSLDDDELEALDPSPDIAALFMHYNHLYFDDVLGACSVEWSSNRMTLCAGVCEWQRHGGCRIKLSGPLLKLRPRRDLLMTLLHEMIHAYMFLQGIRDRDDHGPKFLEKMRLINSSTLSDSQRPSCGYNILVYHSFTDEVDLYRRHHWQCPRCLHLVKRAMNRPPQEADCRGTKGRGPACADTRCAYHMHIKHCGGEFVKVKSPDVPAAGDKGKEKVRRPSGAAPGVPSGSSAAGKKAKGDPKAPAGVRPIDSYFAPTSAGKRAGGAPGGPTTTQAVAHPPAVPRHPVAVTAAAAAAQGGPAAGAGGPAAATATVAVAAVAVLESMADEVRQRCREAALQRVGGASGSGGSGGPAARSGSSNRSAAEQQPLSSHPHVRSAGRPRESQAALAAPTDGGPGSSSPPILLLDDADSEEDWAGGSGSGSGGGAGGSDPSGPLPSLGRLPPPPTGPPVGMLLVACPVCCAQWAADSITNDEMNAHVDACLAA